MSTDRAGATDASGVVSATRVPACRRDWPGISASAAYVESVLVGSDILDWLRTYRGWLTSHCTALIPATQALVLPSRLADRQSQPQQIFRAP